MSDDRPLTLAWLRAFLVLLFLGGLYTLVWWFAFFPLAVVVFAVPPLAVLVLAVVANRRSRVVFGGILLTAGGYLAWTVFNLDTLVTLSQPHLVVVFVASVAVLVTVLLPATRAYYTGPAPR
ncbi:MFS superfamily sulfate permease-like transporter [Lipingzhangella halophila]|uniref:MFS superfamily sulfate permease-like transporter n=1 Tax=Lipingzhangella halophila TaxID=1783352 RepID=A0A7W7RHZ8_9ACTN|nr:hypothetical protein [Lipingzhangella halophila]MBB4932242.1 MFS superfamily sulfate permease-like transporter [Lipingzhangella halophila]